MIMKKPTAFQDMFTNFQFVNQIKTKNIEKKYLKSFQIYYAPRSLLNLHLMLQRSFGPIKRTYEYGFFIIEILDALRKIIFELKK